MIIHGKLRYVTESDLLKGFSDTQIQKLFQNMTVFMPMDGCPSPCDICAFEAKKTVEYVMDFPLIDFLYTGFAEDFNRNQPGEHTNDQLAFRGRNGETFTNILGLHRDYHTYYPRVLTAFPRGVLEVLWQVLEMQFVNENHPHENEEAQLLIPMISRHPTNRGLVNRFLGRAL